MNDLDLPAFEDLFREVHVKCFGSMLSKPLSEPECRHLSSEIEDQTGLVIGWKSIKNYAAFVLHEVPDKQINPSVATLDTLARYLAGAARTSEALRKKNEAHYPYWFRYKEPYRENPASTPVIRKRPANGLFWIAALMLFLLGAMVLIYIKQLKINNIAENFQSLEEADLNKNGWLLQSKEPAYWDRRNEKSGQLTLFTLKGDNWPKTGETPLIRNLLLRKIQEDCFSTEVHLADFVPTANWQQTGLILLEDTTFTGKSIRLSISYNDFFGGYSKPGEIIVQAIASYGKAYSNLEEIVHYPLFTLGDQASNKMVADNLKHSALRIEKQAHQFRFLYSVSPSENFSFKELAVHEFDMNPEFVGVFALKGFVDSTQVIPVGIRFFRLEHLECK